VVLCTKDNKIIYTVAVSRLRNVVYRKYVKYVLYMSHFLLFIFVTFVFDILITLQRLERFYVLWWNEQSVTWLMTACEDDSANHLTWCVCVCVYCLCVLGLRCHLDDACISNPCRAGANCDTSPVTGGYVCSCPPGWKGDDCTEDPDECRESKYIYVFIRVALLYIQCVPVYMACLTHCRLLLYRDTP